MEDSREDILLYSDDGKVVTGMRDLEESAPLKVNIPNGVTIIDCGAFWNNQKIKKVIFPDSVSCIGDNAFAWCHSLAEARLPKNLVLIGEYAFKGCKLTGDLCFPENLLVIKKGAFQNCKFVESILIPSSVISIGEYAFQDCYSLKSIEVDYFNKLFKSAFGVLYDKSRMTLICCPAGFERTSFSIPNGVISIESRAFQCCRNLEVIEIPSSVTFIGEEAFGSNDSLKEIKVDPENREFFCKDGVLYGGYTHSLYYVPRKMIISDLIIPAGICKIEQAALCDCKTLTSVRIPDSVTDIGDCCFAGCGSLQSIYMENTRPDSIGFTCEDSTDRFIFVSETTYETCTLYVPACSLLWYRFHPVFGRFKNIKPDPNAGKIEDSEMESLLQEQLQWVSGKDLSQFSLEELLDLSEKIPAEIKKRVKDLCNNPETK